MHRLPHLPALRKPATRAACAGSGVSGGFTLIELVVALVVTALLATIAYPSFLDAIRKSRRSDAFAAITTLQLAQERWRANNTGYAASLTDLNAAATSASGHYTLSVPEASSSGYKLRAVATGGQARDTACGTMELWVIAGSIEYVSAACSSCSPATPAADPGRCWSR